ncbi:MAG: alginate lyase family protein [Acidobacteriota bacterium]|nr:alginate lyase family protein [Acidobacteriota bacterium]
MAIRNRQGDWSVMTMVGSLKYLKKLRGKSLREIRVRGSQELAILREQFLVWTEMSDADWLRQVQPGVNRSPGGNTAPAVAALILERIKNSGVQTFFPSLAHKAEINVLMASRFAAQRKAIINRAERVLAGKFDLLGFNGLKFGNPIDWHLEPVSDKRTPLVHWSKIDYLNPEIAGDKKITWELNRHQFFVTLGQAYWLTNDERFAESFVALATSWMDANPPGRGINWASSLEVAFRSISWLWALHLFAGSSRLTPEFLARLLKFLTAFGQHVEKYLSHYFSPNTHLTGEALGLFYLGVALPELKRAESWRKKGLKILSDQLYTQIRGDGVYFEQTSYYHRYTADFYLHLLTLGKASRAALPAELEKMLAQMLDHLMWITRPDGSASLVGDDDGGRLVMLGVRRLDDFRDTLATGAAIAGRGDWKFVAGEAAAETLWLLGPEGLADYDGVKATLPAKHSQAFGEAGYFVMRDGWLPESGYVLMDCGPHGSLACGHAHADALSLEFSAGGVNWLTDSGTLTYTGKADLRDYFRSTAAHNTAEVDGQSQSVTAGPFSWSHIAESKLDEFSGNENFGYFSGSHNGYQRLADPVKHWREVLFMKAGGESQLPPYLIVRDRFDALEHHRYTLNYHFPHDCVAEVSGRPSRNEKVVVQTPKYNADAAGQRVHVSAPGDEALTLVSFSSAELNAAIKKSWVSRCYGQCQLSPTATLTAEGKGTQSFASLIIPNSTRKPVTIGQLAVSELGEGGFSIACGKSQDIVLLGDQASQLGSGFLASTGAMAWLRIVGGQPVHAGLIHGQEMLIRGCLEFRSPVVVNQCSMEFHKEWLEIAVQGTNRFELVLNSPVIKVVINGASFLLERRTRRAAFEVDENGWRLKLAQLGMS